MSYSYVDDLALLISSDMKDYGEALYDIREGLSRQAPSGEERLSLDEIRMDDEGIEVDIDLYREDELEDVFRYRIEEEGRTVYIFDHHSGSLILGDDPMAAAASERLEIGMLSDMDLEVDWSPEAP